MTKHPSPHRSRPVTQTELAHETAADFNKMQEKFEKERQRIKNKAKQDSLLAEVKKDQPLGRYFPGLGTGVKK